jgi:hypothetical protein
MGLAVAGLSFMVGGFGAAKYFSPTLAAWSEGKALTFGIGFVSIIALSFLFALRLARPADASGSWSKT